MNTGIVIGSYEQPDFLRLNLAAIRRHCGDIPVLISDDRSSFDFGEFTDDHTNVVRPEVRQGHYGGDLAAFRSGLRWAADQSVEVLYKLSQRFVIDLEGWDQTWGQMLVGSGYATLGRSCAFHSFRLRTEAVGLDVARWAPVADRLILDGRMPEDIVADVADGLGPTLTWRMLSPARPTRAESIIFREANYEVDYAVLARRLGVRQGWYDCRASKAMPAYQC